MYSPVSYIDVFLVSLSVLVIHPFDVALCALAGERGTEPLLHKANNSRAGDSFLLQQRIGNYTHSDEQPANLAISPNWPDIIDVGVFVVNELDVKGLEPQPIPTFL